MPTYNFSDTNQSFTGIGGSDVLTFNDDTGIFDWRNFAFVQNGNNLEIYGNNGYTATVTNHFTGSTTRIETLAFAGSFNIDLTIANLIIADASIFCYVMATNNDDFILGGNVYNALIYGQYGNDTIYAGHTQHTYGGYGDDLIYSSQNAYGDEGNDTIYLTYNSSLSSYLVARGGADNDIIHGSAIGDYLISGDDGDDTIYGNDGNDEILGGHGDDTLYGGAGDDRLIEMTYSYAAISNGNDQFYGGDGDDTIMMGYGTDYVEGGDGNDLIEVNTGGTIDGVKTVYGGSGIDQISGGLDGDYFYGEAGDDDLYGKVGNDELRGGDGEDDILGGLGHDLIYGGSGNDTIYGEDISGYIPPSSDLNDTIYGDDGDDYINGETGDDTLYGGNDDDTIITGAGDNTAYGDSGNDDLIITGYGGVNNTAHGGSGNDYYEVQPRSEIGNTLTTVYDLSGSLDQLYFLAYTGYDTLNFSKSGDDLIIYRHIIAYNTDNDILIEDFFLPGHQIEEFIHYDLGGPTTISTFETLTSGNDNYTGTTGTSPFGVDENFIKGLAGDDAINGSNGNDVIYGGADNDNLSGGAGNDYLFGEGDNDTLDGGSGDDTLDGGSGNDTLDGSTDDDTLFGSNGDDTLYGADGYDILLGGSDSDTFVFDGSNAFNDTDRITDFVNGSGGDYIDISDVLSDFGYNPLADTLSDWVATTSNSGDTLLQIDRDGTGISYSFADVCRIDNVTLSLTDLTTNGNLIT